MPTKPATICNGCNKPTRGSCPRCRRDREQNRPSAHERGYGSRWRKIRRIVLGNDPVCTGCKRAIATEVDHILRKSEGGSDGLNNLQGLCSECHKTKTLRENSREGV